MSKEKQKESKLCKQCEGLFYTTKPNRQVFCSKECYNKYYHPTNKKTKKCKNCGSPFKVRKSNSKKVFCSNDCRNKYFNKVKKDKLITCPSCNHKFKI